MTITTINNIVSSGTAAARPATPSLATPASGSNPSVVYIATDTGAITMWDFAGGAWVAAGGGSGTVTSVSLSAPLGGGTVTTTGTLGTTSYTAHGVVLGEGTSALGVTAAGAANTFLAGVASADPTFRTFTAASADLANQGTTTTVLHGNAAGNPSWAAITLTTDVTGTLPVGNGGTGDATLTVHGVLIGAGTSAINVTAAGTAGQVLTSNGASADPTFQAGGSLVGTYHNVTSSRVLGTIYTNSQVVPIFLSVILNTVAGTQWLLNVNGVTVAAGELAGTSNNTTLYGFANPSDTYQVTVSGGSSSLNAWFERY